MRVRMDRSDYGRYALPVLSEARSPRPFRAQPRARRFARLVCVPVLAAAALAGCGSDEVTVADDASVDAPAVTAVPDVTSGDAATSAPSAPVTAASGSAAPATAAPDTATGPLAFTAPLVGGGTFDGSAYGERPVVLWFWAPG